MKCILKKYSILFISIFLIVICLGLFLKKLDFDYKLMKVIQHNNFIVLHSIFLNSIKMITCIGNEKTYFFIVPLVCVFLYFKDLKKEIIFVLFVLLFSYVMNEIIKYIVCRCRPTEFFIIYMEGYSFPSGHAMNTATFYLTLAYIFKEKLKFKYIDKFFYFLIFVVSISRIILGVHWVSDVLVGLFMGSVISYIFVKLYSCYWRN